jgi:hypothetical protein
LSGGDAPKRKPITAAQTLFAGIAAVTAITTVVCAWYWADSTNTTAAYGGGLNWTDNVFNWHGNAIQYSTICDFTVGVARATVSRHASGRPSSACTTRTI